MYEEYIRKRITELRMRKNVSERCMSLDMGRSQGYINHITSGKAMPSMSEFFEICRYLINDILGIQKQFKDENKNN